MGLRDLIPNTTMNQTNASTATPVSPQAAQAEQNHKAAAEAIKNAVYALGQKYFEANKDKETADFYDEVVAFKECMEKEELWHQYRLSLDGKTLCEHCGAIITSDSAFCNKCGGTIAERDFSSIGMNAQPDAAPATKTCPACGTPVTEGAMFCEKCGSAIS